MKELPLQILNNYNKGRAIKDKRLACLAPFNSMYFLPEGRVIPCCYNRGFDYGTYPENNLHDVWFGDKALQFRNWIRENKFHDGCSLCVDQMRAGNNEGVHTRMFDFDDSRMLTNIKADEKITYEHLKAIKHYPEILEFELDITCNLECIMCHGNHSSLIRKNRENRPALKNPYDKNFVEQLREFIPHVKTARFLGGEPFLSDIYYDIWELFGQMNPEAEIHITTNATIYNGRVRDLLNRLNVNIILSIDSFVKETYEAIRLNAKADKVFANIESFAEYSRSKGKRMCITICPMKQNRLEIPDIVEFCNQKDYMLYINTVIWPETTALRFMTVEEMEQTLLCWKKAKLSNVTAQHRHNNEQLNGLTNQLQLWLNDKRGPKTIWTKIKETLPFKLTQG